MRKINDKDIRKVVEQYIAKGWILENGKHHAKLRAPTGHSVGVPLTPSCKRASLNLASQLRKLEELKCSERR